MAAHFAHIACAFGVDCRVVGESSCELRQTHESACGHVRVKTQPCRRKYTLHYAFAHMAAHLAHMVRASEVDCRVVARSWRIWREPWASNFRLDSSQMYTGLLFREPRLIA